MNTNQTTFNFKPQLTFHAVVVLLMLVGSAYVWMQTPAGAQIPVHFDATMTPDRYGSKVEGLLLLPAITAGLVFLFAFLPSIEPRKSNLMQSIRVYGIIWMSTVALMLVVHIAALMSIMGSQLNFVMLVPIAIGLMLMGIGNYLGKLRSTWFMGIRTPWTLTSELSWNKTHRLGGRLFVLQGLAVIVASAFSSTQAWAIIVGVGSVVMVAILFAYSYVVWKDDPAVEQT